ncbi:MAG TPA: hypothetical protein VEL47_03340 [Myxococcota bacterium]|nr:hypothetical protein [Myxococcota bacterium]
MRWKFVLVFMACLLSETVMSSGHLQLNRGTMSAGGRFKMPYKYDRVGRQTISFREEPEFSYFVWDSLRLIGSAEAELSLRWSSIYPLTVGAFRWGAKLGAEYLLPVGLSIYPAFGIKGGFRVKNTLWDQTQGLLELSAGILWGVNEHVAISFGLPMELAFSKQFGFESIEISPGYLGVVGFF